MRTGATIECTQCDFTETLYWRVGMTYSKLKAVIGLVGRAPGALFCFISYKGNPKRPDYNLTPKTLHSILRARWRKPACPPPPGTILDARSWAT